MTDGLWVVSIVATSLQDGEAGLFDASCFRMSNRGYHAGCILIHPSVQAHSLAECTHTTNAFKGRSAYEPPEQSQHDANESLLNHPPTAPVVSNQATPEDDDEDLDLYHPPEQQYNDRGRPVNPQSRAFARELRAAQNDVLAAVGVCIRSSPLEEEARPPKPEEGVKLEDDELYSSIISLSGVIIKQTSVWWIGALRDRIMVCS